MSTQNPRINWFNLFVFVLVVEAIGVASALLAGDIQLAYNQLELPAFSPPDSLFGVVWPLLYAAIGGSGYLIYLQTSRTAKKRNYTLFGLQMILNFVWSILFFNFQLYWVGLVIIIALIISVLLCIIYFFQDSPLASILLVPYLLWITFAAYLTAGVAVLN